MVIVFVTLSILPFVLIELWFFHKADKRLRGGDDGP